MINFLEENGKINYGLNLYRLSDQHSAGFKLKYWSNRMFMFRYSKLRKKFFVKHVIVKEIV